MPPGLPSATKGASTVTLERITPSHPDYCRDYAACLPLAATIGLSADFALQRDNYSDQGPTALVEWLESAGLPVPTKPAGPTRWYVQQSVYVDVRQDFTIDASVARNARYGVTPGSTRAYPDDVVALAIGRYSDDSSVTSAHRAHLESIVTRYGAQLRMMGQSRSGINRYEATAAMVRSTSATVTVLADSPDHARALAVLTPEWREFRALVRRLAVIPAVLPSLVRDAFTIGRTTLPVELTLGSLRDSTTGLSDVEVSVVHDSGAGHYPVHTAAARIIADAWSEGGETAVAALLDIPVSDAVRTDEWLQMMRDSAQRHTWCPEHHILVARVTHGTRRPFGYVTPAMSGQAAMVATIDIQQRAGDPVTSWHGGSGNVGPVTTDSNITRLERELQNVLRYYAPGSTMDIRWRTTGLPETTVQDAYEPAAVRHAEWVNGHAVDPEDDDADTCDTCGNNDEDCDCALCLYCDSRISPSDQCSECERGDSDACGHCDCSDCDGCSERTRSDALYHCDSCSSSVCEDCHAGYCEECSESYCNGCETDHEHATTEEETINA